jgi:hypothetical protein
MIQRGSIRDTLYQMVHAMIPKAACAEQAHLGEKDLSMSITEMQVYFALNFPPAHLATRSLHPPSHGIGAPSSRCAANAVWDG